MHRSHPRRAAALLVVCAALATGCARAGDPATSGGPDRVVPTTTSTASTSTSASTSASASTTTTNNTTSTTSAFTTVTPAPTRLDDWPLPQADAVAATVPYFLPSNAIPATNDVVRFEFGGTERFYDHTQVWLGGPGFITVVSNLAQVPTTPEELRTDIDTTGWATQWDDVFAVRTDPAYVNLHLVDFDNVGFVQVRTFGVDIDTAVGIASTIRRRASGAGWEVPDLPPDFVSFAEGSQRPAAFRSMTWSNGLERVRAEVRIATDAPEDFELGWGPEYDRAIVDVGGSRGHLNKGDGTVTIEWAPRPDVIVTVGYRGTAEDALIFARSVSEVDVDRWTAASIEPPSEEYFNRCHSVWC